MIKAQSGGVLTRRISLMRDGGLEIHGVRGKTAQDVLKVIGLRMIPLHHFCMVSNRQHREIMGSVERVHICNGTRIMGIDAFVRRHVPSGCPCQSGTGCNRVFWWEDAVDPLVVFIWWPASQS
jgi:hypothetical protein